MNAHDLLQKLVDTAGTWKDPGPIMPQGHAAFLFADGTSAEVARLDVEWVRMCLAIGLRQCEVVGEAFRDPAQWPRLVYAVALEVSQTGAAT